MGVPGGESSNFVMLESSSGLATGEPVVVTARGGGEGHSVLCAQVDVGVATITWEGTIDGSNWIAIQFTNLNDGIDATTATADGLYRATVIGLTSVRARCSSYTSGTVKVTGNLVA